VTKGQGEGEGAAGAPIEGKQAEGRALTGDIGDALLRMKNRSRNRKKGSCEGGAPFIAGEDREGVVKCGRRTPLRRCIASDGEVT
jgi:hypothetical protein